MRCNSDGRRSLVCAFVDICKPIRTSEHITVGIVIVDEHRPRLFDRPTGVSSRSTSID